MALADYHRRSAVAIGQVLGDFDEATVDAVLNETVTEIAVSDEVERSGEGRALTNLLVRLASRLYPKIAFRGPHDHVTELAALARRINPDIEFVGRSVPGQTITVGVGVKPQATGSRVIYAGSTEWTGKVSTETPQSVGLTASPFGAGVAGAVAMAQVFNAVFLGTLPDQMMVELSAFPSPGELGIANLRQSTKVVLVGAGAVGNAAIWALARLRARPRLTVIDPEAVELSNLQRYVLTERSDVGLMKVDLAKRYVPEARTFADTWEAFVAKQGYAHHIVAVSLDSADGRRAVQASLPEWIVNAWTQPEDLGVSHHTFDGEGACLACLYLPAGPTKSEDEIYAEALGIPDEIMQVRGLLHEGGPVSQSLLDLVAQRIGADHEAISAFAGRPIRSLYAEGLCGGAVLPIGRAGRPRADVHVPLAHQSALAGIMLAARLFCAPRLRSTTLVSRINVLRAVLPQYVTQVAARDPRGMCICQDADFQMAYAVKYRATRGASSESRRARGARP